MIPLEGLSKRLLSRLEGWRLGDPTFADPRYVSSGLTPSNFHLFNLNDDSNRLCFVDGGNSTLINSPGLVVSFNRVGFCIYEREKKIEPVNMESRVDFFTIASASSRNGGLKYQVEYVPIRDRDRRILPDEAELVFNSFDRTLMEGRRRASLSRVASVSRAFAEWKIASEVIDNELGAGDMLVRDGSLQTQITGESKYSNMAYEMALSKGVIFTGLAKTSTLFTDTGMPLFSSIAILADRNGLGEDRWYYYPIVDIRAPHHLAYMFAVKLHPLSKHVFRFEVLSDQAEKMEDFSEVVSMLAQNANDLTFPGYPYGLIEADQFVRVRSEELEPLLFQLLSAMSSLGVWEVLESFVKAVDAHRFLDEI